MHVHFIMQKEIREKYPKWIDEINNDDFNLGFTADMDGLLCSAFLKHHKGLEVNQFYDFKNLYQLNLNDNRETIFVDCALKEGKTFDNHMTRLARNIYINPESANINNVMGVHRGSYTDKFAMSTLIQLYAIYNVPLPKTLQGKLILLLCDVGFKGYYSDRFRPIFLKYLEMFNMLELVEVLEQFTRQQMYDLFRRAQMDISIHAETYKKKRGHLFIDMKNDNHYGAKWYDFDTGMDLDWFMEHLGYPVELPQGSFKHVEGFTTKTIDAWLFNAKTLQQAHSYAFINKNKVMISLKKEGESA